MGIKKGTWPEVVTCLVKPWFKGAVETRFWCSFLAVSQPQETKMPFLKEDGRNILSGRQMYHSYFSKTQSTKNM